MNKERRGTRMNKAQTVPEVRLDEMDIALIQQLELDARQSAPEIAKTVGSNPTTVRRRLQWLLDEDIISIVAIPNPFALGFKTRVFIGVNVDPGTFSNVANALKPDRHVRLLIAATGRYDMLLSCAFQSRQQLLTFVDEKLGGYPGVHDVEVMTLLKVIKNSWMRLGDDEFPIRKSVERDLDKSELALIRELEQKPRASITDLGKKLNLSRISVRKRLQSLMDDNIIQVISVANAAAFGHTTQASILVKAKPGQINEVADRLASDHRIHHVAIIDGRFNIATVAAFQTTQEMGDFLVSKLGKIPGVLHHETMLHVGMPKQSFEVLSQDSD